MRRVALTLSGMVGSSLDASIKVQSQRHCVEALENSVPLHFETMCSCVVQVPGCGDRMWWSTVCAPMLRYRRCRACTSCAALVGDERLSFATVTPRCVPSAISWRCRSSSANSWTSTEDYLVRIDVGLDIEALPTDASMALHQSATSISGEPMGWRRP